MRDAIILIVAIAVIGTVIMFSEPPLGAPVLERAETHEFTSRERTKIKRSLSLTVEEDALLEKVLDRGEVTVEVTDIEALSARYVRLINKMEIEVDLSKRNNAHDLIIERSFNVR